MSTRSAIIQKTEHGYRGIYCHFDGYETGVGATLLKHYTDTDKVTALINLGAISFLAERVDPIGKHSYGDPEDGTTIAYGRDRGEEGCYAVIGATLEDTQKKIGRMGYVYLFSDGKWTVNGVDLAQAIQLAEKQSLK